MRTIFNISVPNDQYYRCHNLATIIYEHDRPLYFDSYTDAQYEHKLSKMVQQAYKAAKGKKSLYEVLKEIRDKQRKTGSI